MNLYQVFDKNYEWACFAFDVSRNRAKSRVAELFGLFYTDMRCKTLKKGVTSIQTPTVVDCETDAAYKVVLECGYKYYSDEELAEMVEKWENEPFFVEKMDGKGEGE